MKNENWLDIGMELWCMYEGAFILLLRCGPANTASILSLFLVKNEFYDIDTHEALTPL